MKKLYKEIEYDGRMDKECIELCNTLNALPGIETDESCCGHSCSEYSIWFKVTDPEGLFFLTRCVDRRYWKYGYLWKIELSVGDTYRNGYLPTSYHLHSGPIVGEDAYAQADSLVENLNYHINYENFIAGFELNLEKYSIIDG